MMQSQDYHMFNFRNVSGVPLKFQELYSIGKLEKKSVRQGLCSQVNR